MTSVRLMAALCMVSATAFVSAQTAVQYNQDRTAIFGTGNPDTGWTIDSNGQIEVGLRAKNRTTGATDNVNGVYSFATAPSPRGLWNYEFYMNSDVVNGVVPLDSYDWYLGVDQDSSDGTLLVYVQPLLYWGDDSFGNNSTLNGQGVEPASFNDYIAFPGMYNVVENSENITFGDYPGGAMPLLDNATYDYVIFAVPKGASPNADPIVSVGITVVVGSGGAAVTAQNHGQYVTDVASQADQMLASGQITRKEWAQVVSAAARSSGE